MAFPIALAASLGGTALKGLFGKRKPQLSHEQRIARQQYIDMINNGGYAAGEKAALTAQMNRNMGADLGLQGALQNERLAGMGGTAFADAQRSGLAQAYANAQSQGLANINIAGQNRAFQATQALSQLQPTEQSKGNFFDVLGDVGSAAMPIFAYKYGNQPDKNIVPSSEEYKTDIKPTNTRAMLDAVEKMNVRQFKYKPEMGEGDEQQLGLIAEETPEPIATPEHDGVDINQLVMALVGAVQNLSSDLDLVRKFTGSVKEIRKIEKQYA